MSTVCILILFASFMDDGIDGGFNTRKCMARTLQNAVNIVEGLWMTPAPSLSIHFASLRTSRWSCLWITIWDVGIEQLEMAMQLTVYQPWYSHVQHYHGISYEPLGNCNIMWWRTSSEITMEMVMQVVMWVAIQHTQDLLLKLASLSMKDIRHDFLFFHWVLEVLSCLVVNPPPYFTIPPFPFFKYTFPPFFHWVFLGFCILDLPIVGDAAGWLELCHRL